MPRLNMLPRMRRCFPLPVEPQPCTHPRTSTEHPKQMRRSKRSETTLQENVYDGLAARTHVIQSENGTDAYSIVWGGGRGVIVAVQGRRS